MKAPNWFKISEQWIYFSLIAALSSVLIYLSIPNGAHFNYTYRLGQIWLEEDLYSPQDFVLPKSKKTQSNKKNVWLLLQDRPTHFF